MTPTSQRTPVAMLNVVGLVVAAAGIMCQYMIHRATRFEGTRIRRARPDDAGSAADLWLRARKAALDAIPAPAHSDADVRAWFGSHVVRRCELWLAEETRSGLVGILVLDGEWIDQLYVDPDLTGRGIGSRLLAVAKRERPQGLRLWTFASNVGAQRFYERHGFVEVDRTDGRGNEEGAPDILYATTDSATARQ